MSKTFKLRVLRPVGVGGVAHVEGQVLEVDLDVALQLVGSRAAELVHGADMRRLLSESRANDARLERAPSLRGEATWVPWK